MFGKEPTGKNLLDPRRLPAHVAIIMDGNGRWAKRRLMPRIMGHRQGVKTVKEIVTAARELGISYLTLYAFSTENWNRPRQEVESLMDLLHQYLLQEAAELLGKRIRLNAIGELHRLPDRVRRCLKKVMQDTAGNDEMVLTLALSYGGRQEIIDAARRFASLCVQGEARPEDLDISLFSSLLWTGEMPDPDLIIRTSGEKRLSNFLVFQAAYSELVITDTLWPDFHRNEFEQALLEYQSRERRFGMTSEQLLCENA